MGVTKTALGSACICLCHFALLHCAGCRSGRGMPKAGPFDSAKWRSGDARVKGAMAHDLAAGRESLLIGKHEAQIRDLLGEPDSVIARRWSYTVDIVEEFCGEAWTYNLNVLFDEDGAVKEAYLLD